MEFPLISDKVSCAKKAYSFDVVREESIEVIVPDACPDIEEILCVNAAAFARGKETDAGRGSVSGVARAEVVYTPADGGRAARLEAELPFSVQAADSALSRDMNVTARVSVMACSARELNPRKAAISVTVRVRAAFYTNGALSLYGDAGDGEAEGVDLLYETAHVCLPVEIKERTFVITGEPALPRDCPSVSEILSSDVELRVTDAKAVGNKLVFKGDAVISVFYTSDEGALRRARPEMEFSQIVEFDSLTPESEFDISLMLSGAYIEARPRDGGGRSVSAEIHAVAQCVALESREVRYIADAFSPGRELECEYAWIDTDGHERAREEECVARGAISAPDAVGIAAVFTRADAPEMSLSDGQARVRCGVDVTCLYADASGRVRPARTRLEAESAHFDASADASASALAGEASALLGADGVIKIAAPVTFEISAGQRRALRAIVSIAYDDAGARDASETPSLTVTRARPRETLWALAKRYGSGVRLIMDANGLENESDVAPGALLLIPGRRLEAR